MLTHYSTLRAQISKDVAGSLGAGGIVAFGQLTKPRGVNRYGVILTKVDRKGTGRQVQETWSFTVAIMVPVPSDGDPESTLFEIAGALTMRLTPYDLADVPDSPGPYAGVGSLRRVTKVEPLKMEDVETHVGCVLEFSCMTTCYQ